MTVRDVLNAIGQNPGHWEVVTPLYPPGSAEAGHKKVSAVYVMRRTSDMRLVALEECDDPTAEIVVVVG